MMGEETGSVVDSSCEVSIYDAVFGVDDNGCDHMNMKWKHLALYYGQVINLVKLKIQVKKKILNLQHELCHT